MSTARKSKDNSGRRDPRISLNKLGEYAAESNPLRRHRIVYNQKHPDDFIVPYYDPVRDAIVRYIENSERDIRPLRDAIEKLRQNAPESKWKEQRFKSCLGAITSFRSQFGTILQQKKLRAKPVSKSDPTSIHVEGVRVSIRPDLLVCGKNGRGRKIAGAIKLHFRKITLSMKYLVSTLPHFFTVMSKKNWLIRMYRLH